MADLDGDGATTSADFDLIRGLGGSWGEYGIGDLNRDGIVNSADTTLLNNDMVVGNALPAGQISSTDNIIGYAGYIFNAEIHTSGGGGGLYTVRHRHYSPELGRWLTRDPIGYVDGMGLYEYVRSRTFFTDPYGLQGHIDEFLPGMYPPHAPSGPPPSPEVSPANPAFILTCPHFMYQPL